MIRDNVVVACVEVILRDPQGRIMLAKRSRPPAEGIFWTVGGKRMPGESFGETAARIVQREAGLEIDPSRFQYFKTYSRAWARRAEPPQYHGTHTDDSIMILALTDEEKNAIELNSDDLSLPLWIFPKEIIQRTPEFHSTVVEVIEDLLAHKGC